MQMIWSAINWGMHLSFWVALGLILASFVNNRRPARVHASGEVEFAPRSFGILAWIYVAVRMCFIAGDYLRHGLGEPFTFTTGALLGLASLLMIAALPGTVVVNDDGITEVFWFWRNKVVRWKEIVEINTEASGSAVRVMGANRTNIIHWRGLPDRPQFLAEIVRHCGENLPTDFPGKDVANNNCA